MTPTEIVTVLTEVARRAGINAAITNHMTHPEDIEIAMTTAMQGAATALTILREKEAQS